MNQNKHLKPLPFLFSLRPLCLCGSLIKYLISNLVGYHPHPQPLSHPRERGARKVFYLPDVNGHDMKQTRFISRNKTQLATKFILITSLSIIICFSIHLISPATQIQPNSLEQQGRTLYEAGKYTEAAKIWQQMANNSTTANDKISQAIALSNLSLTYQQLGQWEQAKNAIASSLSLLNNTESSPLILAQTLNIQGRLQLSLGQPENALETLQKATAAYKKADDKAGIVSTLINQCQALQALGYYRRAANLFTEIETQLKTQPDGKIKIMGLLSLGNTLRAIGNLQRSEAALQQSLEIAEKLGAKNAIARSAAQNAIASIQLSLANTKRALANRSIDLNEQTQATSFSQAALNLYQQAALSNSPTTRIQALLNQFSLLIQTGQTDAQILPKIQTELNNLPPSRTSVYARINLAQSLLKQSSTQKTEIAKILAKAIEDAQSLQDRRAQSYALGSLAELYEQNRQELNAEELTQKALLLSQEIDASDIIYRWQWQLGRLLQVQGKNEAAIAAYSEAIKTLKSLRSDLATINPEIQFSFRDSIEPVYRQFVSLLLQTPPDKSEVSQKNIKQARGVIESLQLAELDNFFQEACLNTKPELIDQVDKTAATIYPIILPDRIEVILSLPDKPLRHYATNLPQTEVEKLLLQVQRSLARPSSNRLEILRATQQIYDWLIRPAATAIENSSVKTLVFVLDGALRNIPMSVLYDGKQYLFEKYNLALTPGLQLLPSQSIEKVQLRALKLGLSASREGFPPLPGVEAELKQLTTLLPGTVLLNQEFTGASLRDQINASPYPVVHLATHGKFSSNADNTFILAWDGRINVRQLDEYLRDRTGGKTQAIELLVLSACETATGDKRATLGLAGVAIRAGARSTLATLWPVKDATTAKLMTQFYQELATHGKAEALRRAQLSIVQNYKHPYYWAPYVLVGNWL
jgi:CHAT domain-containing protein